MPVTSGVVSGAPSNKHRGATKCICTVRGANAGCKVLGLVAAGWLKKGGHLSTAQVVWMYGDHVFDDGIGSAAIGGILLVVLVTVHEYFPPRIPRASEVIVHWPRF